MSNPREITDRAALARNRCRTSEDFLHRAALDDLKERLEVVNRTFTAPAIVCGIPDLWTGFAGDPKLVADDDVLALQPAAHDLVVHAMCLHWANDPVGQLIQCRRALTPDGLFLAVLFGGETLHELRQVLSEAEVAVSGGLSPRVAPMAEVRDMGGLLQRAGFALPVADTWRQAVSYGDIFALMHDLRAMGEANALADRVRHPTRRAVFDRAADIYADMQNSDGKIIATFDFLVLTGWAPHESQQKPLTPGSATASLADILGAQARDKGAD